MYIYIYIYICVCVCVSRRCVSYFKLGETGANCNKTYFRIAVHFVTRSKFLSKQNCINKCIMQYTCAIICL